MMVGVVIGSYCDVTAPTNTVLSNGVEDTWLASFLASSPLDKIEPVHLLEGPEDAILAANKHKK